MGRIFFPSTPYSTPKEMYWLGDMYPNCCVVWNESDMTGGDLLWLCKPYEWNYYFWELEDWNNRANSWMCGEGIEY